MTRIAMAVVELPRRPPEEVPSSHLATLYFILYTLHRRRCHLRGRGGRERGRGDSEGEGERDSAGGGVADGFAGKGTARDRATSREASAGVGAPERGGPERGGLSWARVE